MSSPYDPQEEAKSVDGMTGSSQPTEFITLQVVEEDPVSLTDDEIMEILRYAVRINR
jgi:hypothetical protein